jgi:hypothetical protein
LRATSPPRLVTRSWSAPAPPSRLGKLLPDWQPLDRIEASDDSDFFQYAEGELGRLAWTFPILDAGNAVIDMVAWEHKRPCKWWRFTGQALTTSLFVWNDAVHWDEPLRLVATPEEWVRDPWHTACLLQPDKIDLQLALDGLTVECSEDVEAWLSTAVARQRKLIFRRPSCPKFPNG